jgi:hypothetical protein
MEWKNETSRDKFARRVRMNNRERMRASNKLVREWLLENGYDNIWFKPHSARNDLVFTSKGNYLATDLYNLFDGICTDGGIVFLQNKTNRWATEEPLIRFSKKYGVKILSFNVTNKLKESKKYKVYVRRYFI